MALRILIAGGYGEVGRRAAAHLSRRYPGRVIIGGRSAARAEALAGSLGQGVRGVALDIRDPTVLERGLVGVGTVLCCVEQREPLLLRAAVDRGLGYTDVTPSSIWQSALDLQEIARGRGARIVVGAGLVPGISSVMARVAAETLGALESVSTGLLLSARDDFGPVSLAYLLAELSKPLTVWEDGHERVAACFSEPRAFDFPDPFGPRIGHRAPFADTYFYRRSLGVRSSGTWLALDPPWLGSVVAGLLRAGVGRSLGSLGVRKAVQWGIERIHRRDTRGAGYALVVEGRSANDGLRLTLSGQGQAEGTAIGAALVVRALVDAEIAEPGVWFPEQVLVPGRFRERLREHGLEISTPSC